MTTPTITMKDLLLTATRPLTRTLRRLYWTHRERHALMCAETEQKKIIEAQQNVRYYQARAAIARSERHWS